MCLIAADGNANSPACDDIKEIMLELRVLFRYLYSQNTKQVVDMSCSRLDVSYPATVAADCEQAWRAAAKAVSFDEEQRAHASHLRKVILANMTRIFQQRESITAQLAASIPMNAGLGSLDALVMGQTQALAACANLQRNLEQAQECMTHF